MNEKKKKNLFVLAQRVRSVRRMHMNFVMYRTRWHRSNGMESRRAIPVFRATYEFGPVSRTADVHKVFRNYFLIKIYLKHFLLRHLATSALGIPISTDNLHRIDCFNWKLINRKLIWVLVLAASRRVPLYRVRSEKFLLTKTNSNWLTSYQIVSSDNWIEQAEKERVSHRSGAFCFAIDGLVSTKNNIAISEQNAINSIDIFIAYFTDCLRLPVVIHLIQ